ncbi:protease inhibitor I9 family protein, partial [Hyalangium sp.]|uniref:protease inhibitor I9 family protein n=1 Tax=Hyalangium sp. TaxID=2028555 RepID=UPI002D59F89D
MKRWGILGLVVLTAACGGGDDQGVSAQAHLCPGVVAGGLPGAELSQSAAPQPGAAGDGRQRFLIRYRDGGTVSASRVSALGSRVLQVYRSVPAVAAQLTEEERTALAVDPDVESIELDVPRRAFGLTVPSVPGASSLSVRRGSP